MLDNRFQGSCSPTLGVELELQLVDASTLALRGGCDHLLAGLPASLNQAVRSEFHACCVEVATDVCRTVDEVRRDLKAKLRWVSGVAAHQGVMLAWGGTHPFSHWRDQQVTNDPRYQALADSYQETLLRQLTFGLHVHVGVESGEAAIRACDRLRVHLPVLLALSANSAFWCGRPTGMHSQRIEVMGSLPTGGIPPAFGSWDAYLRMVNGLMTCGAIESPKDLWWDLRPSPTLGTVEIRVCDMPLGLGTVLGLTALIQCLVHRAVQNQGASGKAESTSGGAEDCSLAQILQQNRWLAARHGLDAMLIDPQTRRKTPLRNMARALIDGLMPTAEALGCAEPLQRLRAKTRGHTGAKEQLNAFERTRNLEEVVRLMTRADSSGHWHPSLSPVLNSKLFMGPFEAHAPREPIRPITELASENLASDLH